MDSHALRLATLAATTSIFAACAHPSSEFAVNHAIPAVYESMDCFQLSEESKRMESRMTGAAEAGTQSAASLGKRKGALAQVAKALAEPALFAMASAKGVDMPLWQIRSAYDQIQSIAARKQCPQTGQRLHDSEGRLPSIPYVRSEQMGNGMKGR